MEKRIDTSKYDGHVSPPYVVNEIETFSLQHALAAYSNKSTFIDRYSTNLTLPDHFEPFEFKNIDINYAFKFSLKREEKKYLSKLRIVKGDGDMDRPASTKSI